MLARPDGVSATSPRSASRLSRPPRVWPSAATEAGPEVGSATVPNPCGIPGCIATLRNSMVPSCRSAALTTSYSPPMLTPPVVIIRSARASWSSIAGRTCSGLSGTMGCR